MSANIDDIINRIKKNSSEENKKLASELKSGLSPQQNEMLGRIMSDKDLLKKITQSEQVQNILRKLGGDKNGHK